MAHSKQARKRIRVNHRKAVQNRVHRSAARTLVRRANEAIESGDQELAAEAVARAIQQLDKTASRGVIHLNNASRRKSRLMAKLNAMDASA